MRRFLPTILPMFLLVACLDDVGLSPIVDVSGEGDEDTTVDGLGDAAVDAAEDTVEGDATTDAEPDTVLTDADTRPEPDVSIDPDATTEPDAEPQGSPATGTRRLSHRVIDSSALAVDALFGFSVSLNRELLAVGAPGGVTGEVRLYDLREAEPSMTVIVARDVSADETEDDFGAGVSLATGRLFVIDGNGGVDTNLRFFTFNDAGGAGSINSEWGFPHELDQPAPIASLQDVVWVGLPGADRMELRAVHIRLGPPNTETVNATCSPIGESSFGSAIALDGEIGVVGAPLFSATADVVTGAVQFFDRPRPNGSCFFGEENSRFGAAVDINNPDDPPGITGTIAVVGAPALEGGRAYLFELDGGNDWGELATLDALPTEPPGVEFGAAVTIFDRRVAVGDPGHPDGGRVYLFEPREGNTWERVELLLPPGVFEGNRFGFSIDLSGVHLVIGAPNSGTAGEVFDFIWCEEPFHGPGCEYSCANADTDGLETGLNCGGYVCAPCGLGAGCVVNTDCDEDLICNGVASPSVCETE